MTGQDLETKFLLVRGKMKITKEKLPFIKNGKVTYKRVQVIEEEVDEESIE